MQCLHIARYINEMLLSGKATVVDPEVARILRLHDFVIADEGIPDGDSGGEGEGNASRRRHSHGRFALIIHKVLAFFPTAARPRYSRVWEYSRKG